MQAQRVAKSCVALCLHLLSEDFDFRGAKTGFCLTFEVMKLAFLTLRFAERCV